MRAVDTNVLVRLIARDDPKQAAAATVFVGPGVWVSHLVLMEAIWVLSAVYDRGRNEIIATVEALLSNETITVQDHDVVAAALKVFVDNKGVSFSDCLILAVAQKNGHTPLGTFDTKLARLDDAALITG